MAYGYCDSCQRNVENLNGEYVCARTGNHTNEYSKCNRYLPDMTNYEMLINLDISDMSDFIARLIGTVLLEYDAIDEECYNQKHLEIKAIIQASLEKKVSE